MKADHDCKCVFKYVLPTYLQILQAESHSVAQPLPTYLSESVFELERRKHAIGLYIR